MSENSDNINGWKKSVFANYTMSDVLKDCKYPILLSLFLTIIVIIISSDIFVSLEKIVSKTISILPDILALLLAGYAIALTLFRSDYGKNIRKYSTGRPLLKNINSSYAATIFIMVIALLFNFVLDIILSLEIETSAVLSKWINSITVFIVTTLLIYSIWLLKDITLNIYNLGQTSSFFDND